MGKGNVFARPKPPEDLLVVGAAPVFVPDPSLWNWIGNTYLDEGGPLYFEGHKPLKRATLGCLWTNVESHRRGKRIVGQTEAPQSSAANWSRARSIQQWHEWFGCVPDFCLTFDAFYAAAAEDGAFCALVDHELCHCAQATNEFGEPRFSPITGEPVWTLKGHDVEEFVSVVTRFGIGAAGEAATDLVIAAAKPPSIAPVTVAQACGTCRLRRIA